MKIETGKVVGIHWAVWFVIVVGVSLIFASLGVAVILGPVAQRAQNALVWMLSIPCGFMVGALVSPLGKTEKTQFYAVASALSALVTGFVLSKLERIVDMAIAQTLPYAAAITTPVLVFAATTLTTVGLTAAIRRYALPDPGDSAPSPELQATTETSKGT
jgi:hypothetical protein